MAACRSFGSGDLQQVLLHPHCFLLLFQDLILNEPEEILHSAPRVGLHGGVEARQGFQLFLLSAAHLQEILLRVHLQWQPPAKRSAPLVTLLKEILKEMHITKLNTAGGLHGSLERFNNSASIKSHHVKAKSVKNTHNLVYFHLVSF